MTNADYVYLQELFPIQAQNVHANRLSVDVFPMCSSAALWPRHRLREATQRLAFVAARSLMSVWCVWGLRRNVDGVDITGTDKYNSARIAKTGNLISVLFHHLSGF